MARLHLQGTRTIIDNLDDGLSVTPILTSFEGVIDCYESTIREEGAAGLYKGFGALIMQCITFTSIIKLSKFVFTQVSTLFFKQEPNYLLKESKSSTHLDLGNQRMPKMKTRTPPIQHEYTSESDEAEFPAYGKPSKFMQGWACWA